MLLILHIIPEPGYQDTAHTTHTRLCPRFTPSDAATQSKSIATPTQRNTLVLINLGLRPECMGMRLIIAQFHITLCVHVDGNGPVRVCELAEMDRNVWMDVYAREWKWIC